MGDQETTDWGRVPGGAIRPLSLHFADPRLEAEFDRYRSREAWRTDRIWSLCAVGFYAFYGLVEYFVLPPELFLRAAVFRYALVLPVMLAALLHTLFRKSSPRQVALRAVALVAVHVAAITLLLATPYPASEIYYLLALLTYVFTQAFTFMRFAATALIGGLAAPFYLASIVWLNPMPGPTAFAFAVVLLSVILTSLFNQHTHEVAQRREFRSRIALERQVHHSAALAETAEASSAAKSNFLAMMSHELRTPLNAILGFTQMIEQQVFGPIGESRYLEYVRDIGRSGRHLLRIINDILDLSQAEAGKMMLREEEVNVAQAIDQSLTLSAPGADETLAAVSLAVMRDLPRLRADPIKLRQMLVNLLSNAFKFTPPDGEVRISARRTEAGGIEIAVSDTGIGIPADQLGAVMEPFSQAGTALLARRGGSGLGLPLVRMLASLHDADFRLDSKPGEGTRAVLTFPRIRTLAPDPWPTGEAA